MSSRRKSGVRGDGDTRSLLPTYCIDTDALIHAHRDYPPAAFPDLWKALDDLIDEKRFFSSIMVLEELKDHEGDVASAWAIKRRRIFLELDADIQAAVSRLMEAFPKLAKPRRGFPRADAFVIGTAKARGARVITHEVYDDGNENRPKIPLVCKQQAVLCDRFPRIILDEAWVFRRGTS